MPLSAQARGIANSQAKRQVVDMSENISMLRPSSAPLLVLTKKLDSSSCSNVKFEWFEDDFMARWTKALAGIAGGVTTLTVPLDEAQLIAVDDIVKVVRTGEVMRVTGITTNSLTVVRGYGETTAVAINTDDKLLVIGNAIMQGAGSPAEKYNDVTPVFNYTQIFRTPYSITNTFDATKVYGKKELDRLRFKRGVDHKMSIEYSLLFGERKFDTSGAQPRTTTGGVLAFLKGTSNIMSKAKASVTEADFIAFCEQVFTYGSETKIVLASPMLLTVLDGFARNRLSVVQSDKDKQYGLDVTSFVTPHGTLKFIKHPLLVSGYDGTGIVLDPEELSYRSLKGRDTSLKTNIQLPDEDGKKEEYITEAGLELRQVKKHGLIQLT